MHFQAPAIVRKNEQGRDEWSGCGSCRLAVNRNIKRSSTTALKQSVSDVFLLARILSIAVIAETYVGHV